MSLSKEEIVYLLEKEDTETLYKRADYVRRIHCGEEIQLRGIIEYTNYCQCRCAYCGLTAENEKLLRYRMEITQIVETAARAFKKGVRTIVLQGGEDPFFDSDKICEIVLAVKSIGDVAVTLSSGEFPKSDYAKMHGCGADRYLLKIETTNPEIYKQLHPDASLENRIRCIRDLKEIGFQTGSGGLIGLPNQTVGDIADDILFCVEQKTDMTTFSPFIPHPETALANHAGGTSEMGHRVIAAIRLAHPLTHIPCSTALATITPEDYRIALRAGANVVMADITPQDLVQYYDLYPGKAPKGEKRERDNIDRLINIIKELGRPLEQGRGDSLITENH